MIVEVDHECATGYGVIRPVASAQRYSAIHESLCAHYIAEARLIAAHRRQRPAKPEVRPEVYGRQSAVPGRNPRPNGQIDSVGTRPGAYCGL